jgi:hypothetical protein
MSTQPRYFIYISDAKLDLLYEQLRRNLPFAAEASAELKFKSYFGNIGLRLFQRRRTQAERINAVEEALRQNGLVGSPDAPLSYFAGTMNAASDGLAANKHAVVFYGEHGNALVGLVGSKKHMIGINTKSKVRVSTEQALVNTVANELNLRLRPLWLRRGATVSAKQTEFSLCAINELQKHVQGPITPVKFLAKRICEGRLPVLPTINNGRSLLTVVGTPIYIESV